MTGPAARARPDAEPASGLRSATAAQVALFLAEESATVPASYNFATPVLLCGAVGVDELVDACHRLVAATPALRLRFGLRPWTGEVGYTLSGEAPQVDVYPGGLAPDEAAALVDAAAREPFEVDEGPLCRFVAVPLGTDRVLVAAIVHHLAVDGVSHARFAGRFAQSLVGPVDVDDPGRYHDLVTTVGEAERAARVSDVDYWTDRLAGGPGQLPLLPDPAPELQRRTVTAGRAAVERLRTPSGGSLFKTVAAAAHTALGRLIGTDTVLCVAASQRPPGGDGRDVIGYFVNQVPLVARATGEPLHQLAASHSPAWSADLRRRNLPYVDLATRAAGRLDAVMLAFRGTVPRLHRYGSGRSATVSLRYTYPAAKTELCLRFLDLGDTLECEVQWGGRLPDSAGEQFTAALAEVLRARIRVDPVVPGWAQLGLADTAPDRRTPTP